MQRFGAITISLSLLMLLCTGSMAGGASALPDENRTAPEALFAKPRHDFGEVFEGAEIKHEFTVENRGNAPLVIKNIRPD